MSTIACAARSTGAGLFVLAVLAACGGQESARVTLPPSTTRTPTPVTTRVNLLEGVNGGVWLSHTSAHLGDVIAANGTGWDAERPLAFYLLTEEQLDAFLGRGSEFDRGLIRLAEGDTDKNGGLAAEFEVGDRFVAANGDELTVEAGTTLYVVAEQHYEHLTSMASQELKIVEEGNVD